MATSSQPVIIDLLVAKFQGLDLTVDGQPVLVYDGIEGPDEEDNFVVVMGWPADGANESGATQEPAYIGVPLTREENYDIAVVVSCFVGGDDAGGTDGAEDAQRSARINAASLESAIEAAMLADPNLSIQSGGGTPPCVWCLLQGTKLSQTPPFSEDGEGAMGRFANYLMRFHVYAVLGGS